MQPPVARGEVNQGAPGAQPQQGRENSTFSLALLRKGRDILVFEREGRLWEIVTKERFNKD